MEFTVRPIAHIRTDFSDKFGVPRQSGRVPSLRAKIVFLPAYRDPDSLRGIEGFSHLWLLFDFSLAHREGWSPTVRPPRLGGNRRVGVFASRSPFRPNPIGLSSVAFLGIEHHETEGDCLLVGGADLVDGTPILDIKPYLPSSDAHPHASAGYAGQEDGHRLRVVCSEEKLIVLPAELREAALGCLAEDPRPSYQNDETRVYSMRFSDYDIHFTVSGNTAYVAGIDKVCKQNHTN